ncbi:hypothetical protein RFI_13576, partial [Reticulomyxa filosa]
NGRKYLASKSDSQLRDDGTKNNGYCKPFMEYYKGKVLQPCGLIARSFFTDRFNIAINGKSMCNETMRCVNYGKNNTKMWGKNWDKWSDEPNWAINGIAWTSDKETKFQNASFNQSISTRIGWWQVSLSIFLFFLQIFFLKKKKKKKKKEKLGLRLPDTSNEDLIVWMRAAGLNSFRKLHRIIREKDLEEGDQINVTVVSWFPVEHFKGKKWVGLGTTTWVGMENYVLAWGLIINSIACIALALIFGIVLLFGTRLEFLCPFLKQLSLFTFDLLNRKLADVNQFQWSNRPVSTAIVSIVDN